MIFVYPKHKLTKLHNQNMIYLKSSHLLRLTLRHLLISFPRFYMIFSFTFNLYVNKKNGFIDNFFLLYSEYKLLYFCSIIRQSFSHLSKRSWSGIIYAQQILQTRQFFRSFVTLDVCSIKISKLLLHSPRMWPRGHCFVTSQHVIEWRNLYTRWEAITIGLYATKFRNIYYNFLNMKLQKTTYHPFTISLS